MSTTFESKHLIYRAINPAPDGDWRWFHTQINGDVETRVLTSTDRLMKPMQPLESHQQQKEIVEKSILGVIISCKPKPTEPSDQTAPVEHRIGYIQLTNEGLAAGRHNRKTKLLIQLVLGARRGGYGTEATEWALNWAFKHAGMHRVIQPSSIQLNLRLIKWYRCPCLP